MGFIDLSCLQCFDTFGLVTGRASSLCKSAPVNPKILFQNKENIWIAQVNLANSCHDSGGGVGYADLYI